MSLDKVTVFKIKPGTENFSDFIRSADSQDRPLPELRPINSADLELGEGVEISVAYKINQGPLKTENNIPWLAFLNSGLTGEKFSYQAQNRFPAAIAAVKIIRNEEPEFYAITFGLGGEAFLDHDLIVRDFGLRVAMNISNTNRLKRVRTSVHEAVSTQSEKQISVGSSFSDFEIDDDKEFLRSVSGAAREEYDYIKTFTGRDSISVNIDKDDRIDWDNIIPRLQELGDAYDRTDFEATFSGYAKFRFETDPEKVEQLDEELFQRIKDGDFANVHLAPPEFIDYDAMEFSFDDDLAAERFSDITLSDLLASRRRAFRADATMKSLRSMKVHLWSVETGARVKTWSAYKCLVAESELNNNTYILSVGQWKQISDDLKTEVDNYVESIQLAHDQFLLNDVHIWDADARTDSQGNPIGEDREAVYNETVASSSDEIFLFDRAKVEIAGERIYEVCDLLHLGGTFVHVKRFRGGAASVSHLFLQGKFYADAFVADPGCRRSMTAHLIGSLGDANAAPFTGVIPVERRDLVTNQLRIIFCILSDRENVTVGSLPFMARYELMHAHKHLSNGLGFQCDVALRRVLLGPALEDVL